MPGETRAPGAGDWRAMIKLEDGFESEVAESNPSIFPIRNPTSLMAWLASARCAPTKLGIT